MVNQAHDGGGGGGTYNPAADTGHQPVEVDIETVYGLAIALSGEVTNIANGKAAVEANFTQTMAPGEYGPPVPGSETPLGNDPRYTTVKHIVTYHDNAMTEATLLLKNFQDGVRNISRITNKIVTEFQSRDALNSADVERVREVTGIPEEPTPPAYSGGPYPNQPV
ncbi:hypothetical protein [Stackebrandtia soli]|uniref:hypothetical protein n=1 Tax=Stackebrandtia soli TaxID=1892856 RepID=UPI0039E91601